MLTVCRSCWMYRVATVGDREHCLHCGAVRAVPPPNPGPDFEEDRDAEMGFRAAPARRRHRHPRGMVRAAARKHTDRDRAELRYNDYPWWSKRDRDHGLLLQKGKRP
jgi:hypothetical protein